MASEVPSDHAPDVYSAEQFTNATTATLGSTSLSQGFGNAAYSNPLVEIDEKPSNQQMARNFGDATVDIELLEKEIAAKEQQRREQQFVDLSGEIAGASLPRFSWSGDPFPEFDTLDEPVWDTIKRDLFAVGTKFAQILVPINNRNLLRDWDLWGPLFICVFISLLLQGGKGGKGPHFTEMFTLTFFGSCVVTLNTKLLGGNISFFQSLCVLGYCLLPPGIAALICKFIEISSVQTSFLFALRLMVTAAGFIWAIYGKLFLKFPLRRILSASVSRAN